MKSGDSMMDAFNHSCADVANAASRLREMRPAALHFTGPSKLTVAVLRKTVREASLVCAALERAGHAAYPFGWSDPEKNRSLGGLTFDLVDAPIESGMTRDDELRRDDQWVPLQHRVRRHAVEAPAEGPAPTTSAPEPNLALRLLHDDAALTLEEQTCILDALGCIDRQTNARGGEHAVRDDVETILAHIGDLQRDAHRWQESQNGKVEPETSDPAVVLGAEGEAGSFVVGAQNEPELKPEPEIDPRQPGQSVRPWIVTRYAPNVIRIERESPFDSPSGAAVCLSDHDAIHVARALRGEIDIERVIALVSPTRFALRVGRTFYDVHEPKVLAARIEEALGETRERDTADAHPPKPANPVKRDADLGDLDVIVFALTSGDDGQVRRALAGPIGIAARSTVERLQSGESQGVVDSTAPTAPTEGGDA